MYFFIKVLITLVVLVSRFNLFKKKSKTDEVVEKQTRNHLRLRAPISKKIVFSISKENKFHQFCKWLGIGQEVEIGVESFDQKYYILSDTLGVQEKFLSKDQIIQIVDKLFCKKVNRIYSKGDGEVCLKLDKKDLEEVSQIKSLLKEFLHELEEIPDYKLKDDLFLKKAFVFELIIWGVGSYAFSNYAFFSFDRGMSHLNPYSLYIKGIICGLIFIGLWFVFFLKHLKSSSRAPVLLMNSLLFIFLSFSVSVPLLILDLNKLLDRSQVQTIDAGITELYTKTTGTGRSRSTSYYLNLRYVNNTQMLPEKLQIGLFDFYKFTQGLGVRIGVRRGFFRSPYISELTPMPWPSDLDPILDQPLKIVSVELKSQLQNINFDLNLSPEEKNQLDWKAEYYPSGVLKQNEPFLQNQRHGLATYWHPNGVKYADIPWYRGQKHGRFKLFRQNGSLEQELIYKMGKPHGLLKWYDEKSKIKLRAYYNHGEVLEIIHQ